jgi:hypothetical protein
MLAFTFTLVVLSEDMWGYLSYRGVPYRNGVPGSKIYWTNVPVKIPKGELVFMDDAGNIVRSRCSNCLKKKLPGKAFVLPPPPQAETPIYFFTPPLIALESPVAPLLPVVLPPAPPLPETTTILPATPIVAPPGLGPGIPPIVPFLIPPIIVIPPLIGGSPTPGPEIPPGLVIPPTAPFVPPPTPIGAAPEPGTLWFLLGGAAFLVTAKLRLGQRKPARDYRRIISSA